jgi:hypothetical protein
MSLTWIFARNWLLSGHFTSLRRLFASHGCAERGFESPVVKSAIVSTHLFREFDHCARQSPL